MLTSPAIVDWLQFTLPVTAGRGRILSEKRSGSAGWLADGILELLQDWGLPADVAAVLCPVGMIATGASAPYNQGITGQGVTYYWHDASDRVDTILCQISGQGCARLRMLDMFMPVLSYVYDRVSRIDVAIDVETDAPIPSLYTTTKRQSYINSKSGQTFYVGSMKSKKYARVYRYAAGHARAAFVRFECVYRRNFAAAAAEAVLRRGIERAAIDMIASNKIIVCDALSAALGGGERLRVAPPVNNGAESTVRWLREAVAPAFRRMVDEGLIEDPQAFVNEFFLGGLNAAQ